MVKGKRCGCTFTYGGGFVYACELHLAAQKARKLAAKQPVRFDLLGVIENRETFSHIDREPVKGNGELPKPSLAFQIRMEYLADLARVARAAIRKTTAKLTRRERDFMHTYSFSSEQVRRSMPTISKKHGGRA
jgi:hypothetical protein